MTNIGKPERVYEIPDPEPVPDFPDFPETEPGKELPSRPEKEPDYIPG